MYLPNKRHTWFEIKKFDLCDSSTGYTHHIELYPGKKFYVPGYESVPFTHAIVKKKLVLSCTFYKKNHLYTDNFYTKIALAEDLIENNTSNWYNQ